MVKGSVGNRKGDTEMMTFRATFQNKDGLTFQVYFIAGGYGKDTEQKACKAIGSEHDKYGPWTLIGYDRAA